LIEPLEGHARPDRVIGWSKTNGLAIFAVGTGEPLIRVTLGEEAPHAYAWTEQGLLVWTDKWVAMVHENNSQPAWRAEVKQFDPTPLIAAGEKPNKDGVATPIIVSDPNTPVIRMQLQGVQVQQQQVVNRVARLA